MLGFRPMKKQQQQQQPSSRPVAITRRRSSSPLPVIYEDHSKSHDDSSDELRNSHSSSSSSGSSSSSSNIGEVIWPPANSPTWPPRDDEPLISRWNDYGAVNAVNFDRYRRQQLLSTSDGDDSDRSASPQQQQGCFNRRLLQWTGSDVTEVTSNRMRDLHHNFTGSLSYSNSGTYNSDSHSFGEEYSFLNDSSFHRRQRIHPAILRIWHLLSVLVMIVFCSSLFLMPSILQQSENGEWGGDVHGQYHGGGKHSSVDKGYGGGNGGQVRSYRDGVYQDSREYQDNRGSDSQTTSWKYPKPWKYLFGMGNDDSNDVNNSSTTDSATAAVNGDGANASNFTASISQDAANTNTATVSIDSTREQEDSMAASLSNVTFATLASIMLPPYLQSTIELCRSTIVPNHDHDEDDKKSKHRSKSLKKKKETSNKLDLDAKTTNILPSQVLTLRKQLLKTRDLIDVFSPVYPPNYNSDRYHPGDLNFETRDIKYAKFNFGLELEKDGKFREDSKVLNDDGGITMGEREMFGHDHGKDHVHGKHDNKQKHHDDKKQKYRLTKAKSSSKSSSSNKHQKDIWKTLRTYLDEGYTTLGQFQDLDHANIQYSQDTLEEYRQQVWEWHVDFMKWIQKNYLVVMRYLSHVCEGEEKKVVDDRKKKSYSAKLDEEQSSAAVSPSCQYTHTHSSHLFWGGIPQQELPDGNAILAHVALGRLGSAQLQRANGYLGMLWDKDHVIPVVDVDEPMEKERASTAVPRLGRKRHSDKKKHHDDGNKEEEEHSKYDAPPTEAEEGDDEPPVHEVYHNLRKELRSFLDEVDLFGTLLLPDTMVRPEVITLGLASDEQVATVTNEESAGNVPVLGEAEPTPPANITVSITPNIGPQISPPVDPDPSSVLTAQSDDKQKTFEALTSLRQTRKLLGDLNDDYTAYTSYVEWDTNHGEQLRLMSKIYTEWNNFRWWAGQIGLSQQIDYLISRMMVDTASLVQDERVDGAQDPIQEGDDAAAVDSNESVDAAAAAPATDEEAAAPAAPTADEEAAAPAQVRDDSVTNNDPESPALESTENVNSPGDLTTFLTKRKIHPTNRVVIGNDAGDADSIVSAIALSYVESTYRDDGSQATPIVSISRESFEKERPEVNLLFKLTGMHDVVDQLLYIEDLTEMLQGTAGTHLDFTLVDQNTLNPALKQYRSKVNVVEIVDHHEDKGESIGTCTGANRTIAFDRGAALVASSCTLVAERLKSYLCNTDANCIYPESIATLLIGVILIDSVNLDQSIGKVTQRDRDAVVDLIQHTEWKPCESKSYVITDSNGDVHVDTGILFDTLQRAKYETSFWNSIAVERALPYDYKEFDAGLDDQHRGTFGIASILMSGRDFIAKEGFVSQTLEFMHTNQISFLAIMFAYYDGESGDVLTRQLGLCADQTIDLDSLMNEMLLSQAYKDASLDLKPVDEMSLEQTDGLQLYLFHQENVKPSRKQIGPMLEEVYGTYLMS